MSFAYQLQDVAYFYAQHRALCCPRLNIEAGKVTALIGANGSGKSTLLNVLAFLEPPSTGCLDFFSERVISKQSVLFRKQIGFLPQKPYLFRGTVADNLVFVLKLHQISKSQQSIICDAMLNKLQITHLKNQSAKKLSGGELQKVALARALITQPKVLLMDEPFSYLDQSSSLFLEQFIREYSQETQKTLIFSTHNRLQGLAVADEVVSLAKGKLIASPLINLFTGQLNGGVFNTGQIKILSLEKNQAVQHASIDPHEIVLSKQRLESSMRNEYQGRVVIIAEEHGKVRVAVQAGELFQVLITPISLSTLGLHLGDAVWVSFKSSALVFF